MWSYDVSLNAEGASVRFSLISPDGEEGFPGTVTATSTYSISSSSNTLEMKFEATSDATTTINMCNHAYWNLSGGCSRNVYDHELKLHATKYLPVNGVQVLPPTAWLFSFLFF